MKPLDPNAKINAYRILELAGDGAQCNVYLADSPHGYFWLIQIEQAGWEPNIGSSQAERFDANGKWVAVPLSGTSLMDLAGWVDRLDLRFIGWRFVDLARSLKFSQEKGILLQTDMFLSLERLVFQQQGDLLFTHNRGAQNDQYVFPPPEPRAEMTPASDVYSLAACLSAIVDSLPANVRAVLDRATAPNPAQRYPNASEFASALQAVLPARQHLPAEQVKNSRPWLLLVGVVLLLVFLAIGAFFYTGIQQGAPATPGAIAVAPNDPLVVRVLDWKLDSGCTARVHMTVRVAGQPLPADTPPQFTATVLDTIPAGTSVQQNAADEFTLGFPGGPWCDKGGAAQILTRAGDKQATNALFYYPGTPDPAPFPNYRLGNFQIYRSGSRYRVYFGLLNGNGGPARLHGPLTVSVSLNGAEIPDSHFQPVDPNQSPLTAALVMDVSSSMKGDPLAKAKTAAIEFIQKLLPNDKACVYRFSTTVKEIQDCTPNHTSAASAIRDLQTESTTSLYDALQVVSRGQAKITGRQAIILLTDGADTNSQSSLAQALEVSQKANIPIYTIGLVNQDLQPDVLRQIASRNGGVYLEAPSPDALTQLYQTIRQGLANQYQLDFNTPFPDQTSGKLQITINDGTDQIVIDRDFSVDLNSDSTRTP